MKKSAGKGTGPSQRQLRVGELVRHVLIDILQRGEVDDPELTGMLLSVSEVSMSPDLKIATVYVSPLGDGDSAVLVDILNRNARFLRGRLAPHLRQMKYMPELKFRVDTSFENYARIDQLLHSPEVSRDLRSDDNSGDGE